jgi:hypothetical protein
MSFKSNLGQNGGPSGGGPSGGGPTGGPTGGPSGAGPATQGGFTALTPGVFPVGAPLGGVCPSGYLPAPSTIVPGGYTCIRAPGSYTIPIYMSGKRR